MDQANKEVYKGFLLFVWYILMPIVAGWYYFGDLLFNGLWQNKAFLFFSLAPIFNAVMDCVENEHINVTVFKNFNPNFWSKRVSWNKAKMIFGYKLDAWHLSKSAMIICLVLSIVFYTPIISPIVDFFVLGFYWNHVFNGFYNHVFKS